MGGVSHGNVQGIAATRFPSHQLSNGLYVSGLPDQNKEKGPTMSVAQMPYTGGDVKKSGELGKMFDIPVDTSSSSTGAKRKFMPPGKFGSSHSGPLPFAPPVAKPPPRPGAAASKSGPLTGSAAVAARRSSNSGPIPSTAENLRQNMRSGSLKSGQMGAFAKISGTFSGRPSSSLKNSGPQLVALTPTGLITSGPISGPLSADGRKADSNGSHGKPPATPVAIATPNQSTNNAAVSNLSHDPVFSFRRNFPRVVIWTMVPLFVMGFIAGAFIIAEVQNAILLIVVAALFFVVVAVIIWNSLWGQRTVTGFLGSYPDSELASAKDGQFVKITGVVTCGSVPLESSFQKVSRCVYTSTGLYEYRSLVSRRSANAHHRRLSWGVRHMERHIVDFYISDFQTGLRALVKAGYGARVVAYVQEAPIVDVAASSTSALPPDFLRWLTERNLSSDDRVMQLREGYVKEGSIVTVLGVVQRHENVLMIVPPTEVISTGFQWTKFLLPANVEGLILTCDDSSNEDIIPV